MRDKILQQLKRAGHGLTPNELQSRLFISPPLWFLDELREMESDKLVFLHRADGSANTTKGEIVLIVLRPSPPDPSNCEICRRVENKKQSCCPFHY